VVLLSGGLDSYTAAAIARRDGFSLYTLSIRYGQRHVRELAAARALAELRDAGRHLELDLDLSQIGGSALTSDIPVPKDRAIDSTQIPVTYVPARNTIFLSLALAWAEVIGADDIFIGVNALDYSGYPDCRPEFIASFAETARLGTREGVEGRPFTVHAPLQHMTKADIAREAARLELDSGLSWSCYDPQPGGRACGTCDSCRLRQKGFAEAGLTDRVAYAGG